jgi:hypothetical protein
MGIEDAVCVVPGKNFELCRSQLHFCWCGDKRERAENALMEICGLAELPGMARCGHPGWTWK